MAHLKHRWLEKFGQETQAKDEPAGVTGPVAAPTHATVSQPTAGGARAAGSIPHNPPSTNEPARPKSTPADTAQQAPSMQPTNGNNRAGPVAASSAPSTKPGIAGSGSESLPRAGSNPQQTAQTPLIPRPVAAGFAATRPPKQEGGPSGGPQRVSAAGVHRGHTGTATAGRANGAAGHGPSRGSMGAPGPSGRPEKGDTDSKFKRPGQSHAHAAQKPGHVQHKQLPQHKQVQQHKRAADAGPTGAPGPGLGAPAAKRIKKDKAEMPAAGHDLPPLASKGSGNQKVGGTGGPPNTAPAGARPMVKKPIKHKAQQGTAAGGPAAGSRGPPQGPSGPPAHLPGSDSGTHAKVAEVNNNSSSAAASQRGDRDSQTHTQQRMQKKAQAKPPDVKKAVQGKAHSQQQSADLVQLAKKSRAVPVQQASAGGLATALGLLNVMEYSSYEQLYAALTRIIAAQAKRQASGGLMPKLVYRDAVGDWLLLSPDEPWGIFQKNVQALMIT